MDPIRFESALRDLDLFLSRGASVVPEPVYERDTRRHVDAIGDRTPLESPDDADEDIQGQVLAYVKIDFQARTVKVSKRRRSRRKNAKPVDRR